MSKWSVFLFPSHIEGYTIFSYFYDWKVYILCAEEGVVLQLDVQEYLALF